MAKNEKKFHNQFYKAKPKIRVLELSRLTQKLGKDAETFLNRLKKLWSHCKLYLPEVEFVKITHNGLEIELQKKF